MKRNFITLLIALATGQAMASSPDIDINIINNLPKFNLNRVEANVTPIGILRGNSFTKKVIAPNASDRGAFYWNIEGYEAQLVYNVTSLNGKTIHTCEMFVNSTSTLKPVIATNGMERFCSSHEKIRLKQLGDSYEVDWTFFKPK